MRKMIDLTDIQADPRAQPRTTVLPERVGEYVEDMDRNCNFPPVDVFFDGQIYWLGDGFHRYYAAKSLGRKRLSCEVHEGGLREAILFSCGANSQHGLRRSNEDKRRAVAKMLDDPEWRDWADNAIARQCCVDDKFVGKCRKEMVPDTSDIRRYEDRHGHVLTMNTAAIGPKIPAPDKQVSPDLLVHHLRDLCRIIDVMPQPADVVNRFPPEQFYLFPPTQLEAGARWLGELAGLWRQKMRESA